MLAVDPGSEESAILTFRPDPSLHGGGAVEDWAKAPNAKVLADLRNARGVISGLVIEVVQPRGQPLYSQLIDTSIWVGRFVEAWGGPWHRVSREQVKRHLLGGAGKGGDPNVRAALVDRFGGIAAIGKKANPGPLYGLSKDGWAALAVAVTYADLGPAGISPNRSSK